MEILDHVATQTAISALVVLLALPLTYLVCARFLFRGSRSHEGIPFSLQIPDAAQEHWKGKRVSVMNIRDDGDNQYIRALCPATGQLLGSFKAADEAAIDDTLARATAAQREWAKSTFDDRRRVLKTIARYISDHQREVARVACRDTGKTMLDAALGEIMVTLEKIKWLIRHGEDALTPSKRPGSTNALLFYKGAEIRYEPLGVVCAMVSWNYPLHNLMGPVVAGLFSGNSVVVKGSEQVVWSSEFFVQIAKRALELEGFDPEAVQLISCWPQHADYLTSHPAIKHITFIGSGPVAHSVCTAAAKSLTPVVTELGGKDPLVVLDDVSAAKVKEIASIIMRGVFQSAGQNCIGVERVIALPKSHEILLDIFKTRVPQLRLGSSIDELTNIDMGALIAAHHLDRLENLVSDAVSQGAILESGGKRFAHPKYPLGIYFEPTLLSGVTKDMKIAQEEVFGPILLLMKAESIDDAIEIANSTQFALGASVFGSSSRDVDRCVNSIRAGNVAINDFATYHLCQLPFGGVGGSGYGKFGGVEGLRGLCLEKSVCYDRFPFISTFIPGALDYPIPSVAKAWNMVRALNDLGYAQSGWAKFKALRRLLGI